MQPPDTVNYALKAALTSEERKSMKTGIARLFIILILFADLNHASAQGTAFIYQGRLSNNGSPANGSYDLRFTLYNDGINGDMIGSLTNAATSVSNGLFIAALDFGSVFNGSNYWLEIAACTNGGDAFITLSPRQHITPTPYAIYSVNAQSAVTATTASSANTASAVNPTNFDAQLARNTATNSVPTATTAQTATYATYASFLQAPSLTANMPQISYLTNFVVTTNSFQFSLGMTNFNMASLNFYLVGSDYINGYGEGTTIQGGTFVKYLYITNAAHPSTNNYLAESTTMISHYSNLVVGTLSFYSNSISVQFTGITAKWGWTLSGTNNYEWGGVLATDPTDPTKTYVVFNSGIDAETTPHSLKEAVLTNGVWSVPWTIVPAQNNANPEDQGFIIRPDGVQVVVYLPISTNGGFCDMPIMFSTDHGNTFVTNSVIAQSSTHWGYTSPTLGRIIQVGNRYHVGFYDEDLGDGLAQNTWCWDFTSDNGFTNITRNLIATNNTFLVEPKINASGGILLANCRGVIYVNYNQGAPPWLLAGSYSFGGYPIINPPGGTAIFSDGYKMMIELAMPTRGGYWCPDPYIANSCGLWYGCEPLANFIANPSSILTNIITGFSAGPSPNNNYVETINSGGMAQSYTVAGKEWVGGGTTNSTLMFINYTPPQTFNGVGPFTGMLSWGLTNIYPHITNGQVSWNTNAP